MSVLPRIELMSADQDVALRVAAAGARARWSFALETCREPWSEPRARSVRIVDLRMLPMGDRPPLPVGDDGFILVLPADDQRACVRYHAYPRSGLDLLLAALVRELPKVETRPKQLIGSSDAIRSVREQIERVAPFVDVAVLISGETGTGKELVAQSIHQRSRRAGAFVAVNCAAIPESLFESELFGHEAGAFTGARTARVGLMETAAGGTLFLDEIGEMPRALQAKLLRVLEARTFRRVGANVDLPLEARIVSATNRPLPSPDGHLRRDLYYRLAGFTIELPPVRAREEDVAQLAQAFLADFSERHHLAPLRLTPAALEILAAQRWPGNVRELKAFVEQIAIVAPTSTIDRAQILAALRRAPASHGTNAPPPRSPRTGQTPLIPPSPRAVSPPPPPPFSPKSSGVRRAPLRDLERTLIVQAFEAADGNLSRAAAELGIPRTTLRDKLRRYGVLRSPGDE